MKYVFAKSINGTEQTGIFNVEGRPKLLCLCTEENSKVILQALEGVPKLVEALKTLLYFMEDVSLNSRINRPFNKKVKAELIKNTKETLSLFTENNQSNG